MQRWREIGVYLAYFGLPAALAFGVMAAGFSTWFAAGGQRVELRARIPEAGGWSPGAVTVRAGQPVTFRLIADDMAHGFAIGQMTDAAVALPPGEARELTVTFTRPGKYLFYCTRPCSAAHWRMRGTIEVVGGAPAAPGDAPLYVRLGLDLDAARAPAPVPSERPSASRGAALSLELPERYLTPGLYQASSPAEVWSALRAEPAAQSLTEQETWDAVAWLWARQTTPAALAEGRRLYAEHCADCHGEQGAGDGPLAESLTHNDHAAQAEFGAHTVAPTNFTDPAHMLAAPPAVLHGKLLRGGMGTGMPYWGPIFTDAQLWALTDYLWTFQFEYEPLKTGGGDEPEKDATQ